MNIEWFTDRIGQTVFRAGHGDITEIEITEKNVNYLHSLKKNGFVYYEKEPAGKPRVHSGPPESLCISREG